MTSFVQNLRGIGWRVLQNVNGGDRDELLNAVKSEVDWICSHESITSSRRQVGETVEMASLWGMNGFPVVEVSHRLAASLMCTSFPADATSDLVIPWPSFVVAVPNNMGLLVEAVLVTTEAETDRQYPATIHFFENGRSDAIGFISEKLNDDVAFPDMDESWNRSRLLCTRLAIGVCLELDAKPYRQTIVAGPPPMRQKRGVPTNWTFKLTRSVKLDCRDVVRSYVLGQGDKINLQSFVRGHHKRQRCGPGGFDRKWIHIEPYWRGEIDAPIAVRTHEVG